jgi:hypothetical protein
MYMISYCDIERIGTPENEGMFSINEDIIEITEKVDGGNGSIFLDESGLIHECSRHRDLTAEIDNEKTFINQRKALRAMLKDKLNPEYIYYFEWMQKHTINYCDKVPAVIGYDIRVKEGAFGKPPMFLQPEEREREFDRVGIPKINVLFRGTVKEFKEKTIDEFLKGSAYYDGDREGIVIKNYGRCNVYGRQMFGKIVNERFKETNHAKFGTLIKRDTSDTQKLFDATVTDARVEKALNKLLNEGGQLLEMKLMQFLPMAIVDDVFKEESRLICKAKVFYPDVFKKLVAEKCVMIIQNKMKEKAGLK